MIILLSHWVVLLNGGQIILSGVAEMRNFNTRVVFISDPTSVLELGITRLDKTINLLKIN